MSVLVYNPSMFAGKCDYGKSFYGAIDKTKAMKRNISERRNACFLQQQLKTHTFYTTYY